MGKRLKIGQALTRWREGEGEAVTGRVTFQLEKVYNTKGGRKYGPYGPYWYVYYWTGADTPSQYARPKGGRRKQRSRYLGKPGVVDPRTITAGELGKLLKERDWSPQPFIDSGVPQDMRPPALPAPNAITLIACSATKGKAAAPAAELYQSVWFQKARAFAQTREDEYGDPWFILSALHGLTDPDEVIEPYDVTLNKMPLAKRKIWAMRVLAAVAQEVELHATITILAGTRYTDLLVPLLRSAGYTVELPLQGAGIGQQLKLLSGPEFWRRSE